MHYKTYYVHIVHKYGVLIDHWPSDLVPFCDLSGASSKLAHLELLWLRWKVRATVFRHASTGEMAAFAAMGLFERPERKRRADYDVVRGSRRDPETRSKRLRVRTVKTPAVVPDGADD